MDSSSAWETHTPDGAVEVTVDVGDHLLGLLVLDLEAEGANQRYREISWVPGAADAVKLKGTGDDE